MFADVKCNYCKHFTFDENCASRCSRWSKSVRQGGYCTGGFEYKTESITVDISRVKDNERFKTIYPVSTNSDVIVSTSAEGTVAVLGVNIQSSNQERFLDEVEKIKAREVKQNDPSHFPPRFSLGDITVQLEKSWKY